MIFSSEKEKNNFIESKLLFLQEVVRGLPGGNESMEDLIQVGCVGLLKAIDQYEESDRETFEQFAESLIAKEIKDYLKFAIGAIEEPESERIEEKAVSLEDAIQFLPNEERMVIELRYIRGKEQQAVADEMGMDRAMVSRLERKALKNVKKYL